MPWHPLVFGSRSLASAQPALRLGQCFSVVRTITLPVSATWPSSWPPIRRQTRLRGISQRSHCARFGITEGCRVSYLHGWQVAHGRGAGPMAGRPRVLARSDAHPRRWQPYGRHVGAKGEKQLYTRNGKVLGSLRPGFHSSEDYTAAIIGNIEESRADGKPFSLIWRCRRRTIRSSCR